MAELGKIKIEVGAQLKGRLASELTISQMRIHELELENERLVTAQKKLEREWRESAYLYLGFAIGLGVSVALYFLVKA